MYIKKREKKFDVAYCKFVLVFTFKVWKSKNINWRNAGAFHSLWILVSVGRISTHVLVGNWRTWCNFHKILLCMSLREERKEFKGVGEHSASMSEKRVFWRLERMLCKVDPINVFRRQLTLYSRGKIWLQLFRILLRIQMRYTCSYCFLYNFIFLLLGNK